ncbi:MAG: hypothetical protein ACJAQT_002507 [Akkermansiaceae bacterium]|jgi:hypothetical protein
MGGSKGLRELMESGKLTGDGEFCRYENMRGIVGTFLSEKKRRGLLELAQDVSEDIRAKVVGSVSGYWGYFDAPAAEQYMGGMPRGDARDLAFDGLIQAKNEYDPEGGYRLLETIEDETRREERREVLDQKRGR